MNIHDDTIVACATSYGSGAVAVIRISGTSAYSIADTTIRLNGGKTIADIPARYMAMGKAMADGQILDYCMVARFAGPGSFTGEDVVEFHVHGNPLIVDTLVGLAVQAGARTAEPGEFTRRAFLNGKMDLTQAEALADVISSESEQAVYLAQRQLGGELRRRFEGFRERLMRLLGLLELELDFVEEGYRFQSIEEIQGLIHGLRDYVDTLIASYRTGERLRRGPRILLLGRPNAGKSSLFNAFVGYARALVSPVAGTTRDYLEERVSYRGVVFHFLDTAGLRTTDDVIEAEGVSRAKTFVPLSDHVLYLIDTELGQEDVVVQEGEANGIADEFPLVSITKLYTKADIGQSHIGGLSTSIYDRSSIIAVLDYLAANYSVDTSERLALLSQRQYYLLQEIFQVLDLVEIDESIPTELLSADLRAILRPLSELTGATTNEDVLNTIFSSFCIGK